MHFTATTRNSRYFEIMDDLDEITATLNYDIWTASNATITTGDNRIYTIETTGFWLTTKQVVCNGLLYATIKPDQSFGLQLYFEDGRVFAFGKQNMWTAGEYLLTDERGKLIASIEAKFQWTTLTHDYAIDIDINALDAETATVLPALLVYSAKYLKTRAG